MKKQETEQPANEVKEAYEVDFRKMIKDFEDFLEIPIVLNVLIGFRMIKVRELLGLKTGTVIDLKRSAGESLMIYLNDVCLAKGEVTVIEETFGIRITEINDPRKV